MSRFVSRTLLVFLLAVGLSAFAQDIKGTVTDPSGAVISGAIVKLESAGQVLAQTTTDSRGNYTLHAPSQVQSQGYTITVTAKGFRAETRQVQLNPKQDTKLSIELAVATTDEQVTVDAKAQGFKDQLDMSEVRESPARDVGEALALLDGVWKLRKGGIANDLVVRGLQQGNINVLVDGSRTYGACPGHMDPPAQHVDFSEVERVDVLKGPYDVTNQGTLGALVNVVTKSPGVGWHLKPSLSLGSANYFNPSVTGSYGNEKFKALVGYSYRSSDPYEDGSGRKVSSYANYFDGFRRKGFDINTGWFNTEFSPVKNQKISLAYTRQVSGMVLYPYLTMDADYDRADRAVMKYHITELPSSVRAVRFETYFTQVQHYMSDRLRKSSMVNNVYTGKWKMASDAFSRVVGGRVETDLGRDFTFGVESYFRNWNMYGWMTMMGNLTTSNAIPDVNIQTLGTFIDYRHSFSDAVKLQGGLRFDHASTEVTEGTFNTDSFFYYHSVRRTSNQDNYPTGNLRLTATVAKGTELFIGAGTSGRLPDAEERYLNRRSYMPPAMGNPGRYIVNMGNPNMPVTRNTEVDLGMMFSRGRAYLKPSLFYSRITDYIIVNDQPQLNAAPMGYEPTARSYQNIDARIYGGEIAYALMLPKSFSFTGGTSYQRGIGDLKPQANVLDRDLPEMPALRSWASLRYSYKTAFAEIGGTAVGRQNKVNSQLQEQPTAGYGILDLKFGYTHKKVYLSFMIDNLLNRYYYEHLSYYRDPDNAGVKVPEPGRNFFGQIKFNF